MQITINQEDIDHGVAGNCAYCPAGRALARAFDVRPFNVWFGFHEWSVWKGQGYVKGKTPREVMLFMLAFDRGEKVTPLTFEIETA